MEPKILVSASDLAGPVASRLRLAAGVCLLVWLAGCGQRGPLTLPGDADFQQRATLPDIVRRQLPDVYAPPPAQPASAPTAPASAR